MGYAFISYSSRQQKDADSLRHLLRENNIDTWMAPYDIPDGSEYADVINNAIRNAACFVLLLTEDAQNSTYVDKEIERALHYGKTIAPIQMDDVVLNDSFSFYLCNQQIEMVPVMDASVPKVQNLIKHLKYLCNDRLPEKEVSVDTNRDKRVMRKRFARLFGWLGIILLAVSLFCGQQYVRMCGRVTHMEMYGMEYVPTLSKIARSYGLFFGLSVLSVPVFLYGYGLKDTGKKTWNPLKVLTVQMLLPAFSVICGSGCAMLTFAKKSVASIVRGLTAYNESTAGHILPRWVTPVALILGILCIATALLSVILAVVRRRRSKVIRHREKGGK